MDDLEVLDGGLGDAAVEVEHVGGGLLVPHGGLVVQLDQVLHPPVLVPDQQPVVLLGGGQRGHPGVWSVCQPGSTTGRPTTDFRSALTQK